MSPRKGLRSRRSRRCSCPAKIVRSRNAVRFSYRSQDFASRRRRLPASKTRSRSETCGATPNGFRCRSGIRFPRSRHRSQSLERHHCQSDDPARRRSSPSPGRCCTLGSTLDKRLCPQSIQSHVKRKLEERAPLHRVRRYPAHAAAVRRRPHLLRQSRPD